MSLPRFLQWTRPILTPKQWLTIFVATLFGALVAGLYGALHDQITYSIAPEYFTALKYPQFQAEKWALPDRWRVALIGFKASWWLGAAVGLLFSRMVIISFKHPAGCWKFGIAVGVVILTTIVAGIGAGVFDYFQSADAKLVELQAWADYQIIYDLTDLAAFIRVAEIHRAGYMGAAAGVLMGAGYLALMIWRQGVRR